MPPPTSRDRGRRRGEAGEGAGALTRPAGPRHRASRPSLPRIMAGGIFSGVHGRGSRRPSPASSACCLASRPAKIKGTAATLRRDRRRPVPHRPRHGRAAAASRTSDLRGRGAGRGRLPRPSAAAGRRGPRAGSSSSAGPWRSSASPPAWVGARREEAGASACCARCRSRRSPRISVPSHQQIAVGHRLPSPSSPSAWASSHGHGRHRGRREAAALLRAAPGRQGPRVRRHHLGRRSSSSPRRTSCSRSRSSTPPRSRRGPRPFRSREVRDRVLFTVKADFQVPVAHRHARRVLNGDGLAYAAVRRQPHQARRRRAVSSPTTGPTSSPPSSPSPASTGAVLPTLPNTTGRRGQGSGALLRRPQPEPAPHQRPGRRRASPTRWCAEPPEDRRPEVDHRSRSRRTSSSSPTSRRRRRRSTTS